MMTVVCPAPTVWVTGAAVIVTVDSCTMVLVTALTTVEPPTCCVTVETWIMVWLRTVVTTLVTVVLRKMPAWDAVPRLPVPAAASPVAS